MKGIRRYLVNITLIIFILLGIIWQHTELITLESYQIRLKQRLHSLKNIKRELSIEIMRLKSPGRLEELAQGLGLVYTHPERVIILPEPKILFTKDSHLKRETGKMMVKAEGPYKKGKR